MQTSSLECGVFASPSMDQNKKRRRTLNGIFSKKETLFGYPLSPILYSPRNKSRTLSNPSKVCISVSVRHVHYNVGCLILLHFVDLCEICTNVI